MIAMSGLSKQEVAAIADHEHIPETAAATLGQYLLKKPGGAERIGGMIKEDIRDALGQGRKDRARELFMALRHFLDTHPEAKSGASASR